jgi:tetratricopeptide (TPR) repeat protein
VSCLVLLFAAALPCAAQTTPRRPTTESSVRVYSIRGNLRYADTEAPVEMVKVELKRFTGEVVSLVFTRGSGEFEFGGLGNGEYLLEVNVNGFEPIRERIEIMNSNRIGVFLSLRKPLLSGVTPGGASVSARELSLPRKATNAFRKGEDLLYDKKNAEGSLRQFQRAVDEHPGYYEAYHQMGVAYLELGRLTEALEAFRRSVEMSGYRYADPHFGAASVLSTQNQFAEAEVYARKGLELNPAAWQGYYQLARALYGLNRVQEAEKNVTEALSRKRDFPELYLLAANIHMRQRDAHALLRDLEEYLKLQPNGPASEQARQTKQAVERSLAQAKQKPPAPPKP